MHVFAEQPLEDKPPSVVTDAGGDTLAKETKSKKGITGSQSRGNHIVFTHYLQDPNCDVCKKTKTSRARCNIKHEKNVDGIALSTKCGDLITEEHNILNVENETKCGHRNALIVQNVFTTLIQSYPTQNERPIGDNVVFIMISSFFAEDGNYSHRQFKIVCEIL